MNLKIYNTKVLKRDALKHLNDSIKNTRDYYYDLMESFQNQENEFNYNEDAATSSPTTNNNYKNDTRTKNKYNL